jgi:hypothetical protein
VKETLILNKHVIVTCEKFIGNFLFENHMGMNIARLTANKKMVIKTKNGMLPEELNNAN